MEEQRIVRLAENFALYAFLGSTAIQVGRQLQLLAELAGHPLVHGETTHILAFDGHLPARAEGIEEGHDGPDPMASTFTEARMADRDSRELLYDRGLLPFLTREQIEHPGAWGDGNGTGATPAGGAADVIMNLERLDRQLSQGLDTYENSRRMVRATIRSGASPHEEALPCFVVFPTVGGQGSGAYRRFCWELRSLAAQRGIKIKIILCAIDAGATLPPNKFLALRNRMWALNAIRAEMTGRYRDPINGGNVFDEPLFDMALISSGVGAQSSVGGLTAQTALLAHWLHEMTCTLLGKRLREDIVDLESHRLPDRSGAPCAGCGFGFTFVHLDRGKIRTYISRKLAEAIAQAILSASSGDAAERGRQAAAELQLLESDLESLLTRCLTAASQDGPDVLAEALGWFEELLADHKPRHGIAPIEEAYRAIALGRLRDVLSPRMTARAQEMVRAVLERVAKELALFGKGIAGLRKAIAYIKAMLQQVSESDATDSEKHEAILQAQEAGADELNRREEELEELRQRHVLMRMTQTFSYRGIVQGYRLIAAQMLRLEVDREACRIAHEDVYIPLQDQLLAILRKLELIKATLEAIAHSCHHRAEEQCRKPDSVLHTPVGHELSTDAFLQGMWGESTGNGQLESYIAKAFAGINDTSGSFFDHVEAQGDSLEADLVNRAEELLAPHVDVLDVLTVFRESFPPEFLTGILDRLIKESGPRIRPRGEAGRYIPHTKLLVVPRGHDWQWLLDAANHLDRSEGHWEVVETPDTDSIILATFRSSVSLTSLIEQHRFTMAGLPARQRIEGSADHLLAIIPAGRMTDEDARVVAAYAQILGLLNHDADSGYGLRLENSTVLELGKTADAVLAAFKARFGDVVHVYSSLGEGLVGDAQTVIEALDQLGRAVESGAADPLTSLCDAASLARVADEVKALMPFMQCLSRKGGRA